MSRSVRRISGWHRALAAVSMPMIAMAWPGAVPPVHAEDEVPVATWYLPMDTSTVCIGQKVVIKGGYNGNPDNSPLAPLIGYAIVNQATHGTVSPPLLKVGGEAGYFTFTFTATSAGTASISSSIADLWGIAKVSLKVTDTCEYIYGFHVNFDLTLRHSGAVFSGAYDMQGGGYLKAKDPKDVSHLANDQQDQVTLGGKLVQFSTKGCQGSNQPLPKKSTNLTVTGTVSEPTIEIRITKGRFAASGTWTLTCAGRKLSVVDPFAGAMVMMDQGLGQTDFAQGTCMAAGGECSLDMPSMQFMEQFFPDSGPVSAVLILDKLK